MPFVNLPINQPLYANVDDASLSDRSPERHDVYMDESGSMVRRPGLDAFSTVGSGPINSIYYWSYTDLAYVLSGADLYSLNEAGTATLIKAGLFDAWTRGIWDEGINPSRKLYGTNGGTPVEYDGVTAQTFTDANAPPHATHLAIFNTYLVANQTGTQKIEYSAVGQPTVFNAEFASAESESDNLVAVAVGWEETAAFGTRSTQFFWTSSTSALENKSGSLVEQGCIAPYTITRIDNSWFFLNHKRRLVRLTNRTPEVLSLPVDSILAGVTTVTDAIGDELTVGGKGFYVLTFPSDNKTYVYDYVLGKWCGQWGYWSDDTSSYNRWRGNCVTYVPEWNAHLVGDYYNGKVYKSSTTSYLDGSDTIRSAWYTGNIDHGTQLWKRSVRLRLRIKRGDGDENDTSPILMVRWRDNGDKTWGNSVEIDLGVTGDNEFFKEIGPLGRYRTRQYEISITDDVPLVLVSVEENVIGAEIA